MSNAAGGLTGPLKGRWDPDHAAVCALLVAEGWELLPAEAPLALGDQALGTIRGRRGDDEVRVGLSVAIGGGSPRTVGDPGCAVHQEPGRALTVQVSQGMEGASLARRLLGGGPAARLDAAAIDALLAIEGLVDDPDERRDLVTDAAIGPLVRVTRLARRAGTSVYIDLFAYPDAPRTAESPVGAHEGGAFSVKEGESSLLVRASDTTAAAALLARLRVALPPAPTSWWRRLAAGLGWGGAGEA